VSVLGDTKTFKYKAFISYAHSDRQTVNWLHRALESYSVPRELVGTPGRDGPIPKKLFPIFRDRDELSTSSDLSASIRESLELSANLIVVCSKSAAASRWVNEEILLFKRLGRADRVHALILDGEPNAASPDEECFPPGLRYELDGDGQTLTTLTEQPAEPIAADLRPEGDGKDISKLKLMAGLLGIPFNSLRRREVVAARRRRRVTQAIAGAIMALVLAVGVTAWRSSHYQRISNDRQIPGVRVNQHTTTLDLTGWAETTQTDIDKKISKAVSTDEYNVTRLAEYAENYVHVEGTTSSIPLEITCAATSPCTVEPREYDGLSRTPNEVNVIFDISKLKPRKRESADLKYSTIFWNAFQTPEQEWAGFRVTDLTVVTKFTVIFPPTKHPPSETIVFYYHDTEDQTFDPKDPDLEDHREISYDEGVAGLVSRVTWEVKHPLTDRSYRIRWNWDAMAKKG
jgi:hypothetical protein